MALILASGCRALADKKHCHRVGLNHPNVSHTYFALMMLGGGKPDDVVAGANRLAANKDCSLLSWRCPELPSYPYYRHIWIQHFDSHGRKGSLRRESAGTYDHRGLLFQSEG